MKSLFFNNRISILFLLGAIISIAFISCQAESIEVDSTIENQLTDHWQVTSFHLDGTDVQGKVVLSSTLHFIPSEPDTKGNFDWNIVYRGNDASENISGSYEINESKHEITFVSDKGNVLKMSFLLHNNQLELSGTHDDVLLLLKAQRAEQSVQK
ncbi:MAG TPA: hypothetical protein PKC76_07660 [Saprospiraceae bacterium]|nr:hypothetical protein [Saprospiraceae bacterium]HMP23990.1 hypothetical protein [Saprospiraceae bacterium]